MYFWWVFFFPFDVYTIVCYSCIRIKYSIKLWWAKIIMTNRQRRNFYLSDKARRGLEREAILTGCVTSAVGTPSVSMFLEKLGCGEILPSSVRRLFWAMWDKSSQNPDIQNHLLELIRQLDPEYYSFLLSKDSRKEVVG